MISEPLEEQYFKWLSVQVVNTRLKNPDRTHWNLLRQLFSTEFVWFVPNDDNRVADGIELRYEFLDTHPDEVADDIWLNQGCSFLEMLIALSRRLSFAWEGASSAEWFWQLMDNVDLRIFDSNYNQRRVTRVLKRLNERTYDENGRGGLFPLRNADTDQRHVEIWYQMQYYLIERS